MERFERGYKDVKGRRNIFAEGKYNELGTDLPSPHGEENRKGQEDRGGIGVDSGEDRLSSFIEPRSMVRIQHQTQAQCIAETNQSKVSPSWRFEVFEVEAL